MMLPADSSIEVTLRSLDGLDNFPDRTFVLSPSTTVPIGRSSKNTTKKLMSGADNAFIDSPVISREHAMLSTSTATGIPTVFITDNGSMHGTFVNAHPLQPKQEHRLHNGDTLQFGLNVVRDQDSFIAKKYCFLSQVPPPIPPSVAVSRGFSVSVPDMSSDEEDIEEEALRTARYGSQSNPVNLDDFEDVPQEVIDLEEEEELAAAEEPASSPKGKETAQHRDTSPCEPRMFFPEEPIAVTTRFSSVAENDSDSDEEPMDDYDRTEQGQLSPSGLESESPTSADEDSEGEGEEGIDVDSEEKSDISNLSNAGSVSHSNAGTDSEEEGSDQEVGNHRLKLEAMIKHTNQKAATSHENPSVPAQASGLSVQSSPYTVQATSKYQELFHSSHALNLSETVSPEEVEKIETRPNNNVFGEVYGSAAWDPLPPRPTAPKSSIWGTSSPDYFQGPLLRGELNQNHWFDAPPASSVYSPFPGPDFRPTKMDYLGQVLNSEPAPTICIPTPPTPVSDEVNPSTSQSNYNRTKVSISEIVEDTPQRTSTPTSVASPRNLKRKAEALDTDEVEATEESPAPALQAMSVTEVAQAVTEEPPVKRRRGLLAATARHMATFVAGGVFALGTMMMVPETIFTA